MQLHATTGYRGSHCTISTTPEWFKIDMPRKLAIEITCMRRKTVPDQPIAVLAFLHDVRRSIARLRSSACLDTAIATGRPCVPSKLSCESCHHGCCCPKRVKVCAARAESATQITARSMQLRAHCVVQVLFDLRHAYNSVCVFLKNKNNTIIRTAGGVPSRGNFHTPRTPMRGNQARGFQGSPPTTLALACPAPYKLSTGNSSVRSVRRRRITLKTMSMNGAKTSRRNGSLDWCRRRAFQRPAAAPTHPPSTFDRSFCFLIRRP